MKTVISQHYSVYPGEFVSGNDETVIIEQSMNTPDGQPDLPNVNVEDLHDEYRVEIAAPGFEREKLIVYANKNDLLVCATDNFSADPANHFQKHVNLPDDADVELTIAEYKNNVLQLYVPKTKQPFKTCATRVVVY